VGGTRRQQIAGWLRERAYTLDELVRACGVPKAVVADDIKHIARSLSPPRRLRVEPSVCRRCGFTFSKRERVTDPSRCPRCRNEWISSQAFQIT
jgi:predicted Zn-ribbon and HTH transcriptional regulator